MYANVKYEQRQKDRNCYYRLSENLKSKFYNFASSITSKQKLKICENSGSLKISQKIRK